MKKTSQDSSLLTASKATDKPSKVMNRLQWCFLHFSCSCQGGEIRLGGIIVFEWLSHVTGGCVQGHEWQWDREGSPTLHSRLVAYHSAVFGRTALFCSFWPLHSLLWVFLISQCMRHLHPCTNALWELVQLHNPAAQSDRYLQGSTATCSSCLWP